MKSPSYTENNIQLYIINSSWKNKNKNLKKEKKKKKKKSGKLENWKIPHYAPSHRPHPYPPLFLGSRLGRYPFPVANHPARMTTGAGQWGRGTYTVAYLDQ